MDSDKVKEIAVHSGTSVSTVRRVLGHCSGITAETRSAVIGAQCALNHPLARTARRLHVILPDNPKFFWHKALDVLNAYPFDPPVKLSFYPSLSQHSLLSTYLQPMREEENTVLILAADPDENERALIAEIAQRSLVIQLCQHTPIAGTVYVGADSYADAYALGRLAAGQLPAPRAVMLQRPGSATVAERCRGFAEGLGVAVTQLPEPEEGPLYASRLARALAPLGQTDLVFSPDGRTAEVCRSLYKLRGAVKACAGYELPPSLRGTPESKALLALVRQDIAGQTRTALTLAKAYLTTGTRPEQDVYFIPSRIESIKG